MATASLSSPAAPASAASYPPISDSGDRAQGANNGDGDREELLASLERLWARLQLAAGGVIRSAGGGVDFSSPDTALAAASAAGDAAFRVASLAVLNPRLVRNLLRSTLGWSSDPTDALLAAAVAGTAAGHLRRPHMQEAFGKNKAEMTAYCLYLSTLGVLGSTLLWAVGSRKLPGNPLFRTVFALSSSWAMLSVRDRFWDRLDRRRGKGQS